jgi:hypothetical protein
MANSFPGRSLSIDQKLYAHCNVCGTLHQLPEAVAMPRHCFWQLIFMPIFLLPA